MHQELYKNKPFKFMHCWQLLQDCQKWAIMCTSIGKGVLDETQMPGSGPTPRPIGNKKAKTAAHKAGASTALHEEIATFIAKSTILKEKMHEDNNQRWNMYYTVQGHKMKEMQEIRGVKEMKVKEMQEAREIGRAHV